MTILSSTFIKYVIHSQFIVHFQCLYGSSLLQSRTLHLFLIINILHSGANMEALDEKSLTPLLTAVSWGKSEAVKCLLDLGAQIDATDKDEKMEYFWLLDSMQLIS